MWLIDHGIDIRCARLKPYSLDARVLIDVQQIIPLPEAAEFQVQLREKVRKEREARTGGADFTRYDVSVDGESQAGMWKRNAILLVCRHLCAKSINPDEIGALFKWKRLWYSVDGAVGAAEFATPAATLKMPGIFSFSPDRWFCEDVELIHANGKTYALTGQWGGEPWRNAMNVLKAQYPQFNIDFTPAT